MSRKFAVITAVALSAICGSAGVASADNSTVVTGGSDFAQSPIVVNAPQQGVLIVNGTLVDGRCIAPWSNGSVLGGVLAPNSRYAACNTEAVHQEQYADYNGLL